MRKIIGMIGLAGLILITAVYAADWSNPNPRSGGDSAGQLLLKHESNMTDLYDTAAGKLNLLKESFAGAASPTSPETGQPWYDTTNDLFQIYDTTWGAGGFYSSGTSSLYNIVSNGVSTFTNLRPITSKGDLLTHNGTNLVRLPLGLNGQVLYVDTSTASGFTYTSVSALPAGNADTTDSYHASTTPTLNTIAVAGAGGTLALGWLPSVLTGKDADTVDGFHASQTPGSNQIPVLSSAGALVLNKLTIRDDSIEEKATDSDSVGVSINYSGFNGGLTRYRDLHVYDGKGSLILDIDGSANTIKHGANTIIDTGNSAASLASAASGFTIGGNTAWHAGNDGAGSGLDADLLDGQNFPLTTKGDLFTFSTLAARLPVGSNGQILTADSAQTTGLVWSAPPAKVETFTASGTWNTPATINGAVILAIGGGGGGGGGGGTTNATLGAGGGGGGAGGSVNIHRVTPAASTAYTVTIGAAGTSGAGGDTFGGNGAAGGAGGTTTVGALISSPGGGGGGGGTGSASGIAGGLGGLFATGIGGASGGGASTAGGNGQTGQGGNGGNGVATTANSGGGGGGGSMLGTTGNGGAGVSGNSNGNGGSTIGYSGSGGGGGSGASSSAGGGGHTGGAGSAGLAGIVIIWWW